MKKGDKFYGITRTGSRNLLGLSDKKSDAETAADETWEYLVELEVVKISRVIKQPPVMEEVGEV